MKLHFRFETKSKSWTTSCHQSYRDGKHLWRSSIHDWDGFFSRYIDLAFSEWNQDLSSTFAPENYVMLDSLAGSPAAENRNFQPPGPYLPGGGMFA